MAVEAGLSSQQVIVHKNGKVHQHSAYEQAFSHQLGANVEAFSFWKGRVALYATLLALGIGEGDEVVLPGYTCVVVPNAIGFTGARPVYVDIAPGTYHIDPSLIEAAITPRTKAIMIQHTFGVPGPIDEVLAIARKHKLHVFEDSAHGLGSTYHGRAVGTFGDAAFFSSQWSKPYTTGLGGMAVTRSPELARRLNDVKKQFKEPPKSERFKLTTQYAIYQRFYSPRIYWIAQGMLRSLSHFGLFVGSSSESELAGQMPADHHWRMAGYQEGAGLLQLSRLDESVQHRKILTKFYDLGLEEAGWPLAFRTGETAFLRYPVYVGNKQELLDLAKREKVELGDWFETPLHPTPLEQHHIFDYKLGQCPVAEKAAREMVNLPMHHWMTVAEADRTLNFFTKFAKPPVRS